jgi:uncharacterized UPF0160 family protein
MNEQSDIQLDLDALAPKQVQIKFSDQTIKINPPTLQQFAKIVDFTDKLEAISKTDNMAQTTAVYSDIEAYIKELIPELKDAVLNMAQILALYKLLVDLGSPTDKAMEKLMSMGVSLDNSIPKVSTSSESLLDSPDTTPPTP